MNDLADIGLIGLAVMGENLALNMESKGFTVSLFSQSVDKVSAFAKGRAKGIGIYGTDSMGEFVLSVKKPRKIMMLVKAGKTVDDFIDQLLPLLEPGDIVIDAGNSYYPDTLRRTTLLEEKGLMFVGAGISGGDEGALHGPSIMPGGTAAAWPHLKQIFQSIAARAEDGIPCCEWIGENGAGHFVKMAHNGIEYGCMQLIGETYHILKELCGLNCDEIHLVLKTWNKSELNSYLLEITSNILAFKDQDGKPLLDKILDTPGQKGTGKWAGVEALELGVPLPVITDAVFARSLASLKSERMKAARVLSMADKKFTGDRKTLVSDLRQALYASMIACYSQSFALMHEGSLAYNWNLNYSNIAMLWRAGCIISSVFLEKIREAYDRNPELRNLMLDPFFTNRLLEAQVGWRRLVAAAVLHGIPVPALSSALAYFDSYRTAHLPANLIQAQRDYFGAHSYERVDKPRGEYFHTHWT